MPLEDLVPAPVNAAAAADAAQSAAGTAAE